MSLPVYELAVERTFDAPRDAVWRAVTGHLAEWWCPRPWTSEIVAVEWKSGGRFAITLRGPEGETHEVDGMLLEVVPGERFVFTNTLVAGWMPKAGQPVGIVGVFEFADAGAGKTSFRSSARHWSEDDMKAHDDMGFSHGWGACADQLEEVARRVTETADA